MVKLDIAQLLDKEMDRKDFLKHVGIGIVALTGFSAVLKALSQQTTSGSPKYAGYGGSSYGGASKH